MSALDQKRVRLRKWYLDNAEESKEKLNAEYRDKPEVREVKITRAKDYREKRKAGAKVERVYYREINGLDVEVYSLGYVADQVGTYSQMLINFEKRGWIPTPTIKEHHRLYTQRQALLIINTVKLYKKLGKQKLKRDETNQRMLGNRHNIQEEWTT